MSGKRRPVIVVRVLDGLSGGADAVVAAPLTSLRSNQIHRVPIPIGLTERPSWALAPKAFAAPLDALEGPFCAAPSETTAALEQVMAAVFGVDWAACDPALRGPIERARPLHPRAGARR